MATLNLNESEIRILVSALDAKAREQYTKLINPHLAVKHVAVYQQLHHDVIALHTKLNRLGEIHDNTGTDVGVGE